MNILLNILLNIILTKVGSSLEKLAISKYILILKIHMLHYHFIDSVKPRRSIGWIVQQILCFVGLLRIDYPIDMPPTIDSNWEAVLNHCDEAMRIAEYLNAEYIKDKLEIHELRNVRSNLNLVRIYTIKSNVLCQLNRLEEAFEIDSIAERIIEDVCNSFTTKEANVFYEKEASIRLAGIYSVYATILFKSGQDSDAKLALDEVKKTMQDVIILSKGSKNVGDVVLILSIMQLIQILLSRSVIPGAYSDIDSDIDDVHKILLLLRTKKKPNILRKMENYISASVISRKCLLLHFTNHPNPLDTYNEAITIWESLENTSEIYGWVENITRLYHLRGAFFLEKNDLVNAGKDFRSSIYKIERPLIPIIPTNSSPKYKDLGIVRISLASSYDCLSQVRYLEGRLPEAINYNSISIDIIETFLGDTFVTVDGECFRFYVNAARLLKYRANPHDFAHEKSRRMVEVLELTSCGEEEWDYRLQLRQFFAEFHANWLNYCIDNGDTHIIPEILSIIQGREIAAEILDKLHLEQDATPETVKKFHALRLKLRKINARIQGIINGGRTSNNASGGDSRMATLSNAPQLTELPPRYHKLVKVQEARLKQLRQQRELVVKEPGYEVLNPIVTTTALQAKLSANEAILLAIDRPHGTPGVLIIRNSGQPRWLEVPQLATMTDSVRRLSDGNSHSRGYRAGSVSATTDEVHIEGIDTTNFWDDIKTQLKKYMWWPLAFEDLVEIKYLTIITHGNLHMSPIEAGAPKYLVTTRMPGLVFFAQRRGIIGKPIKRSPAVVALSIDVHPGGPKMKQIPYVQAEQSALQQLYSGKQVIAPGQFPKKLEQPTRLVHIGSHGIEDETQPGAAALLLAHGTITQHKILKDSPSLWYVYINACIAARTVEDLNGTPSGLTSAVFQLGALQMVGALFAIPDKWAFLLAVLTHQAMLRGNLTLAAALRKGKRRLATGDWFEDTEDLLQNTSHQYIRAFQRAKRLPQQQQELQNFCTQLGLSSQEQTALGNKLASLRGEDWINAAANALASELFTSRIPPQPDLGTLLYGVVVFGEPQNELQ